MATDNNNKVLNVPNLRFPEFCGEWGKDSLMNIASIFKGSGISKEQLSDSGLPCILYGELYTKYKSEVITDIYSKTDIETKGLVSSKANDVIIPCSGEAAIEIATARCVPMSNILLGGDLNIIRLNGHDGRFFAYQLNGKRKIDIAKVAQGVSVVHLYGEHLKKINVAYPSFAEQNKIAQLLSLIDKRIVSQNKIIEDLKKLKVAISNRLLNNNTLLDKTASLSKFGELKNGYAFKSSTYVPNGNYNIITIANVCGSREISTDCSNTISSMPKDIQSHQILKSGDILISLTGNVGRVSLNKGSNNLLNQRVGLFVPNDSILSEFLYQTLSFVQFENSMINLAQGAAQMNIGKSDVESYLVRYSDDRGLINEISQILLNYDKKIEIENKYLQSLLSQKAFLLSNMFI